MFNICFNFLLGRAKKEKEAALHFLPHEAGTGDAGMVLL
jgi:hypothetical protein